jgi:hypothetical protein
MIHKKLSWNTHYLITRFAVRQCAAAGLNDSVRIMSLEEFLALAGEDLPSVIAANLHLPGEQTLGGNKVAISTPADLLVALKLNPRTPIHYVRAIEPEQTSGLNGHDVSRSGPPAPSYEQTTEREQMRVSEIFTTFSDEPDWGMDQELYSIENYPYGHAPFGIATGLSSQAAFHMAFYHENPVLAWIYPDLRITFVDQRARLFLELARFAIHEGAPYWGWRFAAWAAHYLQDVTQPYHARALPFPLSRILWGVVRRLVSRSSSLPKNYLVNRHHIFEAMVHYIMNEAVKDGSLHAFISALEKGGDYSGSTLEQVIRRSSMTAADLAVAVNRTFEAALNDSRIDDPEYSVLEGEEYRIEEKIAEASAERPELLNRLITLICACLEETGMVTRYVVRAMTRN